MNQRVLLVDDEPDILRSLHAILTAEAPGWEVRTCSSPTDALGMLEGVHLVVADHRMPGMTGVELLARIHAASPNVVRVLLTAHADLDIALSAIEQAHVHYYLRKPWDSLELPGLLRRIARREPIAAGAV